MRLNRDVLWRFRWPLALVVALALEAAASWWIPRVKARHGFFNASPPKYSPPVVELVERGTAALSDDGLLYLLTVDTDRLNYFNSSLVLFDPAARTVLWRRPLNASANWSVLEVGPDGSAYVRVQVGDGTSQIRAFDRDGALRWGWSSASAKYPRSDTWHLIAGYGGELVAFGGGGTWRFASDGALLAEAGNDQLQSLGLTEAAGFSFVKIHSAEALFDWRNRVRWQSKNPSGRIAARAQDGTVYLASGSQVSAFRNNSEAWSRGFEGPVTAVRPSDEGTVIVVATSLYSVSSNDGREQWWFRPRVDLVGEPALLSDGTVLSGRSGRILAVRNGELEWDTRLLGTFADMRLLPYALPRPDIFVQLDDYVYHVRAR